ncbi:MAG: SDR family oxidoreductase, partial [Rhodospirillales bacterium]|nr:SDR family oxidoreductase [Rhodospirillales bacterium]
VNSQVTDSNLAGGDEGTDTLVGVEALQFGDGTELTLSTEDSPELQVNTYTDQAQYYSSIAGLKGHGKLGIYGLSKAANLQLVRNLAVEWGRHNVRVNCLAPGLVRTDMARALWEDADAHAQAVEAYPLGRLGEPEDIAGAAVFLASDAGRFVTGHTLVVDGGATVMSGRYT